jgi:SAM-dependent methyltransferase
MAAAISNITKYNERMRRGMLDKTFFLHQVNATSYFDYGCADGSTLEFIAHLFPEHHFFGYDIDPKMIELANAKNIRNAFFSTDFNELLTKSREVGGECCLILNSLIHEIYSYLDQNGIDEFWDRVLNSGFQYISIRDMCTSLTVEQEDPAEVNKIREHADRHLLADFEDKYGSISKVKNLVHYILKCRYGDNWERELNEDYLKCDETELMSRIGVFNQDKYKFIHNERFILPFIKQFAKTEFNYDLIDRTHVKIILGKKLGK